MIARLPLRNITARFLKARKASISVEFALVSVFFLLPLMAGGMDFMLALSARSKLDSALHAIYLFAWSDPENATNNADLNAYIQALDPGLPSSSVTLVGNPTTLSVCFNASGGIDYNAAVIPPAMGSATSTCAVGGATVTADMVVNIVSYKLQSIVNLPVPVPFLANPLVLTASGTIQTN